MSLLKQAKRVDQFSLLITITALIILVCMFFISNKIVMALSIVIFLLGCIEKYYAIRVEFDKSLFNYLMLLKDENLTDGLKQLDEALLSLGLVKANEGQTRSLLSRQQGVMSLLKKQLLFCGIQAVVLSAAFLAFCL